MGVTSWDTSPPLGAGTMPREGAVADGVGFGTGVCVAAPPTPVVGLGLGVLATYGGGKVATAALEPDTSALPGALVAASLAGEEVAV